ncbi:hypothetical protein NX783_25530 [Massilia kyonggiensis]|nr:hypothetical protein [Massilia kyonggiensis]
MTSAFEMFDDQTVATTFSAKNGASELYLIDRSFNEVSRGVGRLDLDLVPGPYRVRERIGDSEAVSEVFEVAVDKQADFTVHGVAFETPLPIAGTATYQEMPRLARPRGSAGIRVVVRDPAACAAADAGARDACMMREVGRMRIETLACDPVAALTEGVILASGNGLFAVDLDLGPGSYVLVQDCGGGRQCCLPLYVMPDWNPAVYFLMPRQPASDAERAGLRLTEASVFYTARDAADPPGNVEMARLEAARHALSRRRAIGGWALLPQVPGQAAFNPLMNLIDAYLLLPRAPGGGTDAASLIDRAAEAFGKDFPDVRAARLAEAQSRGDERALERAKEFTGASLYGPPVLARSWSHLIDVYNGRRNAAPILPFEFSVEPSESWFVWSEQQGARLPARIRTRLGILLERATGAELLKLARDVFERVARSDESADWVRQVQALAAEQANRVDSAFRDPALQRIVAALAMVSDPILQKAFGQTELIERAWASLKVPTDMLNVTLRKLIGVLAENKLLAGLAIVIGAGTVAAALAWLRPSGEGADAT